MVTVLHAVPPKVNEGAVSKLEHLLAMAKSGEIQQLAVGYVCADGCSGSCIDLAEGTFIYRIIGSIGYVRYQLEQLMDQAVTVQPLTPIPGE